MDNDPDVCFLDTMSRALVSLPFDVKVLLEAVADPDLEHGVRELAASDRCARHHAQGRQRRGAVRYAEDVIQLRLALAKIAAEGGEGAPAFRDRFAEDYGRLDEELRLFRQTLWRATSSTGSTAGGPRC